MEFGRLSAELSDHPQIQCVEDLVFDKEIIEDPASRTSYRCGNLTKGDILPKYEFMVANWKSIFAPKKWLGMVVLRQGKPKLCSLETFKRRLSSLRKICTHMCVHYFGGRVVSLQDIMNLFQREMNKPSLERKICVLTKQPNFSMDSLVHHSSVIEKLTEPTKPPPTPAEEKCAVDRRVTRSSSAANNEVANNEVTSTAANVEKATTSETATSEPAAPTKPPPTPAAEKCAAEKCAGADRRVTRSAANICGKRGPELMTPNKLSSQSNKMSRVDTDGLPPASRLRGGGKEPAFRRTTRSMSVNNKTRKSDDIVMVPDCLKTNLQFVLEDTLSDKDDASSYYSDDSSLNSVETLDSNYTDTEDDEEIAAAGRRKYPTHDLIQNKEKDELFLKDNRESLLLLKLLLTRLVYCDDEKLVPVRTA